MNLPNKITIARVFMIPLFLIALLSGMFSDGTARIVAASIFLLAAMSDWADGFLARRLNQTTNFGKFMDPVADKLLTASAFIALLSMESLASWMVIVIISREFIISGVRLVAVEQGVVIAASNWAKLKTAIHMVTIVALLLTHESIFGSAYSVLSTVCIALVWLSVALAVISAFEYVYKNLDVFKDKGAR